MNKGSSFKFSGVNPYSSNKQDQICISCKEVIPANTVYRSMFKKALCIKCYKQSKKAKCLSEIPRYKDE